MDPWTLQPGVIDSATWAQIFTAITYLAIYLLFAVIAAFAFLIGLGFIPSLAATGEAPAAARRLQPVFYVIAALSFVVALFFLAQFIILAPGVIAKFYPKFAY
jgi:hypothetical protein